MYFLRLGAVAAFMMFAFPASAAWLVAETPHFRIYGQVTDTRIRAEAANLEDYHNLLEVFTKRKFADNAPKLDIYLVDRPQDMLIVRPELPKSAAGVYVPSRGGIFALSSDMGNDSMMSGREVLLHEYAHHYMMQVGNTAVPAWYVEGFAEYLMTSNFRPDRIEFGGISKGRYWTLTNMSWLPLEQVLQRPTKSEDQAIFYAQSWLLTHYLNRVQGMPAKRDAYLNKVAQGADPVEAFRTEVDPNFVVFNGRLKNYISGRSLTYSQMTRTASQSSPVKVRALPAAADAMLLPFLAVQLPQEAEDDAANMQRLRTEAARHPDDPWVKRTMAIAEAAAGDPKLAAALLDAQLAARPDDAELLRWRADVYQADRAGASAEDISAARKLLVRAFKAEPNNWLVLRDYVETFTSRGVAPPPAVLEVMATAHNLAPQERSLAYLTGTRLAEAGHYPAAALAIAPIVNNPHNSSDMTRQRALLTALQEGDKAKVDLALKALSSKE